LSAQWRFDDEGSSVATDSSGNGNHGSFVGDAHYQNSSLPPIPGDAATLAIGGSGYVTVPSSSSLSQARSFSVAAWVSLDVNNVENNIVSKDAIDNRTNYNVHVLNNRVFLSVLFDQAVTGQTAVLGTAPCNASVAGDACVSGVTDFVDGTHPLGTWRHV